MSEDRDSGSNMRVDTDLIRQLADLLTQMDLTEIEVEDEDRRIVVKRKVTAQAASVTVAAPASTTATPGPAPSTIPITPTVAAVEDDGATHPGAIKSPMVGTVYLSPDPGSGPFVAPGTIVKQGDTLLIVEAMKVMNPITAPRAGTVTRVMVQDAQPVEYDQPLVIIE